jgi:hypothetical protein
LTTGVPDQYSSKVVVITNRIQSIPGEGQIQFDPVLDTTNPLKILTAAYSNEEWFFNEEADLASSFSGTFPEKDWMIFIHGDGKTLWGAVDRARELQELHHVNVIVFSWPSKDPDMGAIKNFKNSYANVENSTGQFATIIEMFADLRQSEKNPFQDANLTLFLHSLGNYYLARMYEDGIDVVTEEPVFDNLIINAAAVEAEDHHLWIEPIDYARRIYVNSNDDDFSLSGLRVLTRMGRQLGESPLPPLALNANYVDFTESVGFKGMGPSHSYFFASVTEKSEVIKSYYTTIFQGREAPLVDPEYFAYIPSQDAYTIKF